MNRHTPIFIVALLCTLLSADIYAALPSTGATGYLYNAATGKFLSHGVTPAYLSGAKVDDYGVPIEIKNEGNASEFSGYTYLRLQMCDYYGHYLRVASNGLDCTGTTYHKWAAIETSEGILLRCIYQPSQVAYAKQGYFLSIDDDGALVLREGEDNAAVWQWKSASEQIALVDAAEDTRIASIGAQAGLEVQGKDDMEAAVTGMTAVDKTSAITNPTMYESTTGWTVENIQGTAINNGSYEIQNAAATQASVSQRITGLAAGLYEVKVQAFYRASVLERCVTMGDAGFRFSNAYIAAGSNKTLIKDWYAISTDSHSKPVSRGNIKDEFNDAVKYTHTIYTYVNDDGVLDISIVVPSYSKDSYPNWICFNNVRLTYYFSPEDLSAYESQLSALRQTAMSLSLPAHQRETLNAVVGQYDRSWSTSAEYVSAIEAMEAAIETANTFVGPYAAYIATRESIADRLLSQTDAYSDPSDVTDSYHDIVSALNVNVEAAENITDIAEAQRSLWAAALTWMKGVVIDSNKGIDLSWMIQNADFSDSNYLQAWTESLDNSTTVGVTSGVMRYYNSSFDLSQTLPYILPAGTYRMKVDGFERTNDPMNTAYADYVAGASAVSGVLYLGKSERYIMNLFDVQSVADNSLGGVQPDGASFYVANGSSAANKYIAAGLYHNTVKTTLYEDGTLTVGYRCANTKAWTCIDNFQLFYFGKEPKEEFTINAANALTPLCVPFRLNASDEGVVALYGIGSVVDGQMTVYPVSTVSSGTPCVAQLTGNSIQAWADDIISTTHLLPWGGGILETDVDHYTWKYVDMWGNKTTASDLTVKVLDFMDMDFSANMENWAVSRFLNTVTYETSTASVVADYNVSPPSRRDIPNLVAIPLPPHDDTALLLEYSDNETLTDATAIRVSAESDMAYIANLIPHSRYYYRITAESAVVSQGTFTTAGSLRMIYAPSANNIRDLGGWVTSTGATVNYGHLYRGSTLNGWVTASEEDLNTLRALGIGGEIDLRWKADYDKDMGCGTSPFGFTLGEDYYFAAANDYLASDLTNSATKGRLKDEFLFILSHFREGKAVYFHCAWGADRTGMLAFLLEGLLGVTTDGLYKDYELTSFSPAGNRLKSALQERLDVIQGYSGDTLRDRFEYYFLNVLGVSQTDIDYFREVMLSSSGDETGITILPVDDTQANRPTDGKYLIKDRVVIIRDGRPYTLSGQPLH